MEQFTDPITCLALRKDGLGVHLPASPGLVLTLTRRYSPQLACCASKGFALLEGNSTLRYICRPLPREEEESIRFNDGACDSKGRFFAGTISSRDNGIPGQLWRYDPADDSCVVVDDGPFTVCCSLPHTDCDCS